MIHDSHKHIGILEFLRENLKDNQRRRASGKARRAT